MNMPPPFADLYCLIVYRRRVTGSSENNVQYDWKVWNLRCIRCGLPVHARNLPHHAQVLARVSNCLLSYNAMFWLLILFFMYGKHCSHGNKQSLLWVAGVKPWASRRWLVALATWLHRSHHSWSDEVFNYNQFVKYYYVCVQQNVAACDWQIRQS